MQITILENTDPRINGTVYVEQGTAEVSFLLPKDVGYHARLECPSGVQIEEIISGKARFRVQRKGVYSMSVIESENPLKVYRVGDFEVVSLNDRLKSVYEMRPIFSEDTDRARLESVIMQNSALQSSVADLIREKNAIKEELDNALSKIANLARRIYALENDNDPLRG